MVYAPRGQGKTFFAHAVAMAVAGGGRFLRWHSPQASPVLIVDGEMPAALLQHRLIKARDAASRRPPRGNVNLLASDMCEKGLPSLATQEGQNFLLERLNGEKLVIFDNISTLCGGIKENEAEAWHPVSEFALLLRRQGIASLFIHHAGKSGEQRGTSKREDNMDTVISLDPPPDSEEGEGARFCVRFTKARSFWGSEAETFDARMQENGTWETVDAMDARDRQILDLDGEGLSQRDIAREVGCAQSLVSKVLKRAREREHQKAFKGEGIT
jgi:putative DNA primase/helicase